MLELADFSRTIIGLGVVLFLLAVVFWLLRRFGPANVAFKGGAERRLAVVESLAIDPRTRLVLVRQDAQEHLIVLTSSGTAALIQSSGKTGQPADAGGAG